ncbi:MAG: DNA damage-inducible protein D, partial [Selenomonas sp.]|nr:DNA damage-inducible protein D [Selenomonas sp.]
MFFFFFFDDNAIEQGESAFESIKHTDETGGEYWTARELMPVLEYVEWRKFRSVIKKAMKACEASKHRVSDHFVGAAKMINLAKGAVREVEDYNLTRYACYLIAMNGDPRKKAIAMAQTYFAVKTRQQEIFEQCGELSEDAKRLAIRQQMKERNKMLANAAKAAGIEQGFEYAVFQDEGYKGLYGGLTAKGIHAR